MTVTYDAPTVTWGTLPLMPDIAVGDRIHDTYLPRGVLDATVLEIRPCEADGQPGDHPSYRIEDPETPRDV